MRLLPDEPWSKLLKRRLKQLVISTGLLFLMVVTVFVVLRLYLYVEYKRALSFYTQLNAVDLGEAKQEVSAKLRPFEDRWNNENNWWKVSHPDSDATLLSVDPWHVNRPFPGPKWLDQLTRDVIASSYSTREKLGLRTWMIESALGFSDNKLESVETNLIVEGQDGRPLGGFWHYLSQDRVGAGRQDQHCFSKKSALEFGHGSGIASVSYFVSSASVEEKQAMRELNLGCINRSAPCAEIEDIAPKASTCSQP